MRELLRRSLSLLVAVLMVLSLATFSVSAEEEKTVDETTITDVQEIEEPQEEVVDESTNSKETEENVSEDTSEETKEVEEKSEETETKEETVEKKEETVEEEKKTVKKAPAKAPADTDVKKVFVDNGYFFFTLNHADEITGTKVIELEETTSGMHLYAVFSASNKVATYTEVEGKTYYGYTSVITTADGTAFNPVDYQDTIYATYTNKNFLCCIKPYTGSDSITDIDITDAWSGIVSKQIYFSYHKTKGWRFHEQGDIKEPVTSDNSYNFNTPISYRSFLNNFTTFYYPTYYSSFFTYSKRYRNMFYDFHKDYKGEAQTSEDQGYFFASLYRFDWKDSYPDELNVRGYFKYAKGTSNRVPVYVTFKKNQKNKSGQYMGVVMNEDNLPLSMDDIQRELLNVPDNDAHETPSLSIYLNDPDNELKGFNSSTYDSMGLSAFGRNSTVIENVTRLIQSYKNIDIMDRSDRAQTFVFAYDFAEKDPCLERIKDSDKEGYFFAVLNTKKYPGVSDPVTKTGFYNNSTISATFTKSNFYNGTYIAVIKKADGTALTPYDLMTNFFDFYNRTYTSNDSIDLYNWRETSKKLLGDFISASKTSIDYKYGLDDYMEVKLEDSYGSSIRQMDLNSKPINIKDLDISKRENRFYSIIYEYEEKDINDNKYNDGTPINLHFMIKDGDDYEENNEEALAHVKEVRGVGDTKEFKFDGNDTIRFVYENYDCADFEIEFDGQYEKAITKMDATISEGSYGFDNPTINDNVVFVDNVTGGSDLYIYIDPIYSIEYYLNGDQLDTDKTYKLRLDENDYSDYEDLGQSTLAEDAHDYTLEGYMYLGKDLDDPAEYKVNLRELPKNSDGWFSKNDKTSDKLDIDYSYQYDDFIDEKVTFEDNTFKLYAISETVKVTYKIKNGTWEDGKTTDIVVSIPKNTSLSENNSNVPTGMKAKKTDRKIVGYWDTEPDTEAKLTEDVVYTYVFENGVKVKYHVDNGKWNIQDVTDKDENDVKSGYWMGTYAINNLKSDGSGNFEYFIRKGATIPRNLDPDKDMTPIKGYKKGQWVIDDKFKNAEDYLEGGTLTVTSDIDFKYKFVANDILVHFDKNHEDAKGEMEDKTSTYDSSKTFTLNENTFEKTGYKFKNWNTKDDGSGDTYEDKASVKRSIAEEGDIELTLYALWTPNTYTIEFDSNGGNGEMDPLTIEYDEEKELPENTFTKPGYTFDGWVDEDGNTYKDKDSIKNLTAEDGKVIKLTAQWVEKTYTITYDPDGGTWNDGTTDNKTDTHPVTVGSTIFDAPVKEGYEFVEWKGSTYQPGDDYNEKDEDGLYVDDTLTAIWKKKEEPQEDKPTEEPSDPDEKPDQPEDSPEETPTDDPEDEEPVVDIVDEPEEREETPVEETEKVTKKDDKVDTSDSTNLLGYSILLVCAFISIIYLKRNKKSDRM